MWTSSQRIDGASALGRSERTPGRSGQAAADPITSLARAIASRYAATDPATVSSPGEGASSSHRSTSSPR